MDGRGGTGCRPKDAGMNGASQFFRFINEVATPDSKLSAVCMSLFQGQAAPPKTAAAQYAMYLRIGSICGARTPRSFLPFDLRNVLVKDDHVGFVGASCQFGRKKESHAVL
jgi:hypothetical protein